MSNGWIDTKAMGILLLDLSLLVDRVKSHVDLFTPAGGVASVAQSSPRALELWCCKLNSVDFFGSPSFTAGSNPQWKGEKPAVLIPAESLGQYGG